MCSVESPRSAGGHGRELSGRRWVRRSTLVMLAIAGLVAGAVAVRMQLMDRRAVEDVSAVTPQVGATALQAARVLGSIRKLKLVTVELASHVNAESTDESWRGDVHARVDAPVKLHFGTDLSRLKAESLRSSTLGNSWVVTVPAPERVATEVFGEREQTDVRVGWMRSRSMAGEKHLGLARKDLYEAARHLRLSEEDSQRVRAQTREQVGTLVRSIVGEWSSVTVRFEDEVEVAVGP